MFGKKQPNLKQQIDALLNIASQGSASGPDVFLAEVAEFGQHVTDEQLLQYWDKELDADAREHVDSHVVCCPVCFEQYAAAGRLFLERRRIPDATLQVLLKNLTDPLIEAGRESVREFRDNIQRLLKPAVLQLAAAEQHANAWRVLGPVASKVRPGFSFRWLSIQNATIYDFALYCAEDPGKPVVERRIEANRECDVESLATKNDDQLKDALVPGEKYLWSVRALDKFRTIVGSSGKLSFEVMERKASASESEQPLEPIQSALLLATDGLLDDAIDILEHEKSKPIRKLAAVTAMSIIENSLELPKLDADDKEELEKALADWGGYLE
ncbi:MAG: hypothetical protein FVQ79_12415 [Planctomycetes bacterium]|nr:hypothetical protein [Planctomycetota bacterium]